MEPVETEWHVACREEAKHRKTHDPYSSTSSRESGRIFISPQPQQLKTDRPFQYALPSVSPFNSVKQSPLARSGTHMSGLSRSNTVAHPVNRTSFSVAPSDVSMGQGRTSINKRSELFDRKGFHTEYRQYRMSTDGADIRDSVCRPAVSGTSGSRVHADGNCAFQPSARNIKGGIVVTRRRGIAGSEGADDMGGEARLHAGGRFGSQSVYLRITSSASFPSHVSALLAAKKRCLTIFHHIAIVFPFRGPPNR